MRRLVITQAHYDEIVAHALAEAPNEVCGLISGRDGIADAVWRGRNVAANPRLDYEMEPQMVLKQLEFEEQGQEMAAIYHSHPQSSAYPSAIDALRAYYPDSIYVICSLMGTRPTLAAFRIVQGAVEPAPALPPDATRVRGRSDLRMRYLAAAGERPARYELYSLPGGQQISRQIVEIEEVEILLIGEALRPGA